MSHKQWRQLTIWTMHLAQALLRSIQGSGDSRSFAKFCLEDRENSNQPSEIGNDQSRAIIIADALITTWEVAQEVNVSHPVVTQHLKQIGKVKKLDQWVSHELAENQNRHSEASSLTVCNSDPFLHQIVTYYKTWILWQPVPTNSVVGLRRGSKHFHGKKVMAKVWLSPAGLIHYSFLNPGKIITSETYAQQIDEKHANCSGCSWLWSTERAQFFSTTAPNRTSHNQCFKSQTNWPLKFCLICHIHLTSGQPATISSSILTAFHRENTSTTSRRQKNAFQEFVESLKHFPERFLHTWIKYLFLIGKKKKKKKCWL